MKRIFVWALILALLCGMALAEMEKAQDRLLPDPNAGAFTLKEAPKPNVSLPGWGEINIDAGTEKAYLPFYNPAQNEGWYDLTFALWAALPEKAVAEGVETQIIPEVDKETGELRNVLYAKLMQSGLVSAGLYLQNVTLTQPVPKGSYAAFVQMQPYHTEEGTPTMTNGKVVVQLNAN